MRRNVPVLLAGFALLFMQSAGVHLHADLHHHHDGNAHDGNAHDGDVHGIHIALAFSDHHTDDDSHADVSVTEPAPTSPSKVDMLAGARSPSFAVSFTQRRSYELPPHTARPDEPDIHWRPPTRAPPAPI